MLLALPDLLTEDELALARRMLAQAPWADGRIGAGSQAVQAKNNEQLPKDCEAARSIGAMVLRALDRSPQFLSACLPRKVFPPRINRYSGETNAYGKHVDGSIRFGENGQRVRTDISCTVFLSDPGDYDGGELVVYEAGDERRFKPPAGDAVLYPGTHVHEVLPVTRGTRMAAFFWVESLVRTDEQRRLLHEFDLALTSVRQISGESPATVALMGTYHNLLRMWADT
ncbi:Fe2+-dependent dioxygenase [Ramlibacter henchirensis]|uniref:Fe2+-dependent dioxygenase n=1 Tax=Ramlibacter henchirensis TaxID=204072 RepID=A0A4Z0BMD6_9BURK|nr:Fe2+-dependent dioxygenase [Ramlibacter henchirensis]TFZ00486.1 Fe2+-dependent dioxygenase [Ramlibacter henchirensis]